MQRCTDVARINANSPICIYSCFTLATPICLLFLSVIALQLSRVSILPCASLVIGNSTNNPSKIALFFSFYS